MDVRSRINTLPYPVVQVAYFVADARQAALQAAELFGAGPFFFIPRIELSWGEHRGRPNKFVHSSAYGQWGEVMLEYVQQDEEGPSPFRDMFPPGQEGGVHHMATMVDSMTEAYAHFQEQGFAIAARAQTLNGTEFAFIDTTPSLGHMIEIYARSPELLGFYRMVKEASLNWQGDHPVRDLGG